MHHFAVIGNPIEHSLSPLIHQHFAKQCGLAITYEKILAPLDGFEKTVDSLRARGITGANVTLPFKEAAFAYANQHSERAIKAGSVNTLIFQDELCIGDNTDGVGLLRDLEKNYIQIRNKRILILGAGGAARGAIAALHSQSPAQLSILNRTDHKARVLAHLFDGDLFNKQNAAFDLVINTTNADFQESAVFNQLNDLSNTDCYDLNYGDRHRPFAQWTRANHAKSCHDGLGMLIEQAAESFFQWTGMKPATDFRYSYRIEGKFDL